MEYFLLFVLFIVGFFIGWIICMYRIAKDQTLIRIASDEAVCKKPPEGYILVAVTPDVARKLSNTKQMDQTTMRQLLWNQNE